jgi:cephalosporin hydroxylase
MVTPGSYLIVEDGWVDLFPNHATSIPVVPGPLIATREFLVRHPEFAVDRTRERYLLTYNPGGFLRRNP